MVTRSFLSPILQVAIRSEVYCLSILGAQQWQCSSIVEEGGNKGNNDEIGYGSGNGVFFSIYVLLAPKSGMKLLEGE